MVCFVLICCDYVCLVAVDVDVYVDVVDVAVDVAD